MNTWALGMDLSGPSNNADTSAALLVPSGQGWRLQLLESGLDDAGIGSLLASRIPAGVSLLAGLDAPLSYNPGGGDRPADKALRAELVQRGLPAGTVMTPTMTRMAYLTLRGLAVARLIQTLRNDAGIFEVHPGGVLVRRGASAQAVRGLKQDPQIRRDLLVWLAGKGLQGLPGEGSDHEVAALAAALAATEVAQGKETWRFAARPPLHPFDLIC